jgi:outer membrane receptor protein involved in Fe transport
MLDATAYAVDTSRPSDFGIGNLVSEPIGLPNANVVGWFQLGHGTAPFGWRDPKWTVRNTFSYVAGQHSLRAGAEWRTWRNRQYGTNQGQFRFDGTFSGNALADFLTGRAATVSAVFGDQTTRLKTDVYGLFVQDDIQVSRRLTLNAGLRWEYYTPPAELQDRDFEVFDETTGQLRARENAYRAQKNNIAPRIGFAFDPAGDGKTAIRGGFGLFYNQGTIAVARNLVLNPPVTTSITFRGTTLGDPFAGQGTAALATLDTVGEEIETPLVRSYNVNVQREIVQNTMVEVGYYGSHGRNLELARDINQAVFIPGQSTAVNTDQRRPYPGYGSITEREFVGESRYDSLRLALSRRMSAGLSLSGSYVLAKAQDDGSSGTARPQNNLDRGAEKGLADFDVRHRIVVSYIWELPGTFQSRALNAILGGWQISGASQWQSGSPLNITLSTDNSLTGNRLDRPNLVGDAVLSDPLPTQWFNVGAFARPAAGEFGTMERNSLTGASFANTDLAFIKKLALPKDVRAEFRFEVYNVTNTANFGTPNLQFGSATFGQISRTRTIRGDAGSSRQLQLGFKLHF